MIHSPHFYNRLHRFRSLLLTENARWVSLLPVKWFSSSVRDVHSGKRHAFTADEEGDGGDHA